MILAVLLVQISVEPVMRGRVMAAQLDVAQGRTAEAISALLD